MAALWPCSRRGSLAMLGQAVCGVGFGAIFCFELRPRSLFGIASFIGATPVRDALVFELISDAVERALLLLLAASSHLALGA